MAAQNALLLRRNLLTGFLIMLVYLGAIEVIDEIELNVSSESLDIPVWLYTIATPLFSALIIVRILQRTVEDIQKQNF